MATMEQIEILMSAVGPVLDPLAVQAFEDAKCWAIAYDEDTTVLVHFDEQKRSLVLSCALGEPPPGERTALYEKLLRLNFHWDVTGGNRMAIDGPGGKVVQIFETAVDGLDATGLSALLAAFAQAAAAWRHIVQRPASGQSAALDPLSVVGMRV